MSDTQTAPARNTTTDTITDIGFEGDVAIVTGAGGGLGRAHALELARRGARIVVNDIGGSVDGHGADGTPAQVVVKEIEALGGEAVANFDSVHSIAGGQSIVETALTAFGQIDIVVNNAGIIRDGSFKKSEPVDNDAVLDTHLRGAINVTHAAWPHMYDQGRGRIIMTTSASGLFGNFGQVNYGAAKMGLVGLTKALAIEGVKKNIMVNAIAPVGRTRMTEDIGLSEELLAQLDPETVAAMVTLLASSACPITGQIFSITGRHVGLVKIVETDGWTADDTLTPEGILAHIGEIGEDSQLTAYNNMTEAVMASAAHIMG